MRIFVGYSKLSKVVLLLRGEVKVDERCRVNFLCYVLVEGHCHKFRECWRGSVRVDFCFESLYYVKASVKSIVSEETGHKQSGG